MIGGFYLHYLGFLYLLVYRLDICVFTKLYYIVAMNYVNISYELPDLP